MDKYLKDLMDLMFLSEEYQYLSPLIMKLYPDNPNDVHASLPNLFDKYPMLKDNDQMMVMDLLVTVSTTHPDAFTDQQIKSLVDWHLDASEESDRYLLMIFRNISMKRPRKLVPHLRSFLKPQKRGHVRHWFLNEKLYIIGNVGVCDKTLAEESMDFMVSSFGFHDPGIVEVITSMIATLMKASKQYMHKYRKHVEKLEKNGTTPYIKNGARHILNILDGKVIEEVFDDVQETKETVNVIDKKVNATIGTVITIGEKVVEHDKDISKLQTEVDTLDERVDDVEDDLGETKVKVEAIDNKTMTNAPKWSRDLTKLMNPTSSADWRLLAQRLQYNNDDIRGWAQQNDPCMAVLSEWYATHKTSEATKAILKILEDMNRMDAVVIVENAMKGSEGVVEDEEFEYASPPPIFLSYQWGMQEEVKLLKQHLLMAGFECWMDIGQMGGGDKLFNKIDDGIRAAKVVISCTTEKYAQSPNCNREVNLAVNLGKSIIPLLMEKMDWPPKGSMGPIFSEYLFIRFFQRNGEETKESDQRYWPLSKFNELLMQIHLHIVPDERIVTIEYKNWWNPIMQAVVIDKNKGKGKPTQAKSSAETKTKDASDKSPLVFLSYQWDRQPQVLLLYQRLRSLGYSVWMDIHQMGGGDSLYDKIDRGLRGCKVIVSCVTPKYSLSANCRSEVSLADALKKPIIPLLLEEMKWPPGGPMSMVFTELLFINMYKDPNTQKTWSGPKFDELIQKLQEHIPSLTAVVSVTTADTKPSNGNAPNKTDPKATQANAQPDKAKPTQKGSHSDSKSGQSKGFTNKWEDKLASPKPTESSLKANPTKPLSEKSREKTDQSNDGSTGNSKSLEAPHKETETKLKVNPTESSPEKSKDTSQSKDSSTGKAKSLEASLKATENKPKANQTNSSPIMSKETSQSKSSSPGKSTSLEKLPKTTENTPNANPTNPSSEMSQETGRSKSCVLL
ncbi:hypothetical protein DPMN_096346 [Dreissena polymorpha]|uniref:Death domain-containing protein n=2 Tax=Dreissena polymorpha TaxID=45954 RepID=A0A9D4LB65_DREPO|nr:hypothetical protein DPMN_096346 [Dreissena polymorpha]